MNFRNSAIVPRGWITDSRFYEPYDLVGEYWKDVNRFRGHQFRSTYQVSNKGRVRNIDKHILRTSLTFDGYDEIHIPVEGSPNSLNVRLHTLVLTIFAGNPPEEMVNPTCQHINHDKRDNRIENLCWMSAFDNNQEGHGTPVKIVDASGEELIFPSQKAASSYIGRYEDYISECVKYGYRIKDASRNEVKVLIQFESGWIEYVPAIPNNKRRCKLVIDDQTHIFDSFFACDRFLNKPKGYTSNAILNKWPILTNKLYKFYIFNPSDSRFVEYVAISNKAKNFATRCQFKLADGTCQVFSSISAASKVIGRNSEYLRINLRDNKPIRDRQGNLVEVIVLN